MSKKLAMVYLVRTTKDIPSWSGGGELPKGTIFQTVHGEPTEGMGCFVDSGGRQFHLHAHEWELYDPTRAHLLSMNELAQLAGTDPRLSLAALRRGVAEGEGVVSVGVGLRNNPYTIDAEAARMWQIGFDSVICAEQAKQAAKRADDAQDMVVVARAERDEAQREVGRLRERARHTDEALEALTKSLEEARKTANPPAKPTISVDQSVRVDTNGLRYWEPGQVVYGIHGHDGAVGGFSLSGGGARLTVPVSLVARIMLDSWPQLLQDAKGRPVRVFPEDLNFLRASARRHLGDISRPTLAVAAKALADKLDAMPKEA